MSAQTLKRPNADGQPFSSVPEAVKARITFVIPTATPPFTSTTVWLPDTEAFNRLQEWHVAGGFPAESDDAGWQDQRTFTHEWGTVADTAEVRIVSISRDLAPA